ncbi:2331_t:CDS:10 [Acaulospora morrowiae]|uniref:2331_t:CDS:1 n=1 Tax=Acaulospora morrowiae TaxID=94023 RepID=A0A9N8W4K8_9GLOM|nr:2331_t:CDS:10 [Acaulospora morrowiae]
MIISVFLAFVAVVALSAGVSSSPIKRTSLDRVNPFVVDGNSGIAAMHIVLTEPNKIVIIDKAQDEPVRYPDGTAVISLEYDLTDGSKRFLPLKTNTFCSAGGFLANGSLVHTGGAEDSGPYKTGFESLRIFNPCQDGKCEWYENPVGLTSKRWYPSVVSLSDGRLFILGGSTQASGVNSESINNPTFEFFPRTDPNPVPFQFLVDTLPYNLYPAMHLMPGPPGQTQLFILANRDSIIWDWSKNTIVKKLPQTPGPPRSYPLTGTSVMLPLDPADNYKPIVLVCGGNEKMDRTSPASDSCARIDLSNLETATWEVDNFGGMGRVMPDAVILADGRTLFLNGAGRGIAGYNSKDKKTGVVTQLADEPVLAPVIYDFKKPLGQRFATQPPSQIPRLYHSVATLIPDGRVFVTGSSPQINVVTNNTQFPTDFRVEYFSPSYITQTKYPRPTITSVSGNKNLNKGAIKVKYDQDVTATLNLKAQTGVFTAALIHYGFVTHSTHMSQRYVICQVTNVKQSATNEFTMSVKMPPNPNMIAPGINYLYINNHGIPATTAIQVSIS